MGVVFPRKVAAGEEQGFLLRRDFSEGSPGRRDMRGTHRLAARPGAQNPHFLVIERACRVHIYERTGQFLPDGLRKPTGSRDQFLRRKKVSCD